MSIEETENENENEIVVETKEETPEVNDYSLSDAFDAASEDKDLSADNVKDNAPESSDIEGKAQSTIDESVNKTANNEELVRKAKFFDAMDFPAHRKMVFDALNEEFGQKTKPVEDAGPNPEIMDVINSLDPEVKGAINHLIESAVKPYQQKFDAFMQVTQQKEQDLFTHRMKAEYQSFAESNKAEISEYKNEMIALANKYPTMMQQGKAGLEDMLKLVASEGRTQKKVENAVREALLRVGKVKDGVRRVSSPASTSGDTISASKGNKSLEECYADAMRDYKG